MQTHQLYSFFNFLRLKLQHANTISTLLNLKQASILVRHVITCPHVFVLFPQCGIRIKDNEIKNECKPCLLGKTYSSHEDISSCEPFKPCTRCSIGWKENCCLAIWKMTSVCSNHVLLVATMTITIIIIINKCLSGINPLVQMVLYQRGPVKTEK